MIRKFLPLLILLVIGLIPVIDLLHPGLPITHDGQDHVARIANFYQNLSEGNIIPRWAANLNWGYGHPILMFLYPLPSYAASLFHFLGFNLVDSLKIVFALTFALSGLTMYLWTKNFLTQEGSLVASALYIYAPYRFIDFYVRGDIGEHVAFLFIPLILYFILKLSKSYSSWLITLGSLSFAGLILSHNAMSLMFLPIIFLYSVYLYFQSKQKEYVKNISTVFLLGFSLSAFFWIPGFFEGKFTLRDIVTANEYKSRFINLTQLIYGSWNYGGSGQFTVQLGIIHWLLTILAIPTAFILYVKKNNLWILVCSALIILALSIFIMLSYSSFIWQHIKILQNFQFPWRFLAIPVLITSVLGGIVISQIEKFRLFVSCLVLVALLLISKDSWKASDYKIFPESFFTSIYNGTTDTGESSPIWSIRFMLERPKIHTEVIDGNAKVVEVFRNSTKHEYRIDVPDKAGIRENTVYFPGWTVKIDGKPVPIVFQDGHNRGVITFAVPKGQHKISVEFGETKLRFFSDILSIFSLGVALSFLKIKKYE